MKSEGSVSVAAAVKVRVLIVEHDRQDAERLVAELVRAGFDLDWSRVDTPGELIEGLYPAPDVILCDHETPGLDAMDVLNALQRHQVERPVIVISGQMDEEICVKALRLGAVDYLLKDRLARLGPAVEHAIQIQRLAQQKRAAELKERTTATILRALVAHAPAPISVKSVDGRYLLANRQFEQLRGLEPGYLIGRIDAELFEAPQARVMTELDARCLRDSLVLEQEEELVDPAGTRTLVCVRYPVSDEAGEVFGIGSIHLDNTRQKAVGTQQRPTRAVEQRVSVPAVVSSAVSILGPSLQQAGLSISVQLDEAVPAVSGDRDQLERVVMNLLANAITFSEATVDGGIEIAVSSQGDEVSLTVREHGNGPGRGTTTVVQLPALV